MYRKHAVDLRDLFTMFEAVREHSKRQRLRASDCFLTTIAVNENPR